MSRDHGAVPGPLPGSSHSFGSANDRIAPPDPAARAAAEARQARLTKPAGALGRLEELSLWLASVQGTCPPRRFRHPRVVVFAGDHGVARLGVSAYPPDVTAQMVRNIVTGGAAINVLAGVVGATVRVVDMAVDSDPTDLGPVPASVFAHRVRRGSGPIDREDALTHDQAVEAIMAGRAIADEEVDAGADVLVAGDMGIGNTTPSAVLAAVLCGAPAAATVGRGTGIDDATWRHKQEVVAAAVTRADGLRDDPVRLLATVGGADLAAITGFLLQAAVRGVPAILDGLVSSTCALVADRIAPRARHWWVAGHLSPEPAHRLVLDALGLVPVLDLGMRLGEGTGALMALPVLAAAGATLAEMATFAEAGVSDRPAPPGNGGAARGDGGQHPGHDPGGDASGQATSR